MMNSTDTGASSLSSGPFEPVVTQWTKLSRQYRQLLDRAAPHMMYRWLGTLGLVSLFMLRILLAQGVSAINRIINIFHLLMSVVVVYWSVFVVISAT